MAFQEALYGIQCELAVHEKLEGAQRDRAILADPLERGLSSY